MSTMLYNTFTKDYDDGVFSDHSFGIALISEDYQCDPKHKYNQIAPYIICTATNVLTWAEFNALTMGEIIEKHLQSGLTEHLKGDKKDIFARVDKVLPAKAEKVKEKFQQELTAMDFMEPKESGLKYMVTFYVDKKNVKLAWCEEI